MLPLFNITYSSPLLILVCFTYCPVWLILFRLGYCTFLSIKHFTVVYKLNIYLLHVIVKPLHLRQINTVRLSDVLFCFLICFLITFFILPN